MDMNLNQDIEQTAFAGKVLNRLDNIESDVIEVKTDVRWLRDNVKPFVVIAGGVPTMLALISLAKSLGVMP